MEPIHFYRPASPLKVFNAGFTLIELMVVLAIVISITGVVFTSQSSFNKTLVLANTAYDVALTIRSAEMYGLGNRAIGGATNIGYGINFQKAVPGIFTLFADTYPSANAANCHGLPVGGAGAPNAQVGDCVYEVVQGEKVSDYTLGNGITIQDFCAYYGNGTESCAVAHGGSLSSLDIVFARPSPNPFMSVNEFYSSAFPVIAACITLSSPQGGSRFVGVSLSGAISASATPCL